MGMEGAVGEGQGGGRMMSIEWVEYVGNCGAEGGGPGFGGFISAAATTKFLDGWRQRSHRSFFFVRLVACPLRFSGGGLFLGVLGERV